MNEDTFNLQIRKFLKKVGITSQREIEAAVRKAIESGDLSGSGKLHATVTWGVEPVGGGGDSGPAGTHFPARAEILERQAALRVDRHLEGGWGRVLEGSGQVLNCEF